MYSDQSLKSRANLSDRAAIADLEPPRDLLPSQNRGRSRRYRGRLRRFFLTCRGKNSGRDSLSPAILNFDSDVDCIMSFINNWIL